MNECGEQYHVCCDKADGLQASTDACHKAASENAARASAAEAKVRELLLQLSEAERKGRDLCQQNGELLTFLHRLKEDFCGWTCPSVWKTAEGQPHDQRCKDLRAMLDPTKQEKRKCECVPCSPCNQPAGDSGYCSLCAANASHI